MKVLLSFFMVAMVISTVSVAAKPSFLTRAKARLQHAVPLAEVKEHVGKVVQVTAFTALLLAAPIVGHASNTGLETSLAIPSASDSDIIDSLSQSHFSGGMTLGKHDRTGSAGLMFNIDIRNYYSETVREKARFKSHYSGVSFDAHIAGERYSSHQWLGRAAYDVHIGFVEGLDAFETMNGKVSPLLFFDTNAARHRVSDSDSISIPSITYEVRKKAVDEEVADDSPNYHWLVAVLGVGGEFSDGFSSGRSTSIQLRVGAGIMGSAQLLPREQLQGPTDTDADLVGALKLLVNTDGVTFGDILGKEQSSRWHWLPLVPRGKVSASLYKPVFDGGDAHSGDVSHSLQVHLKVGGPVFLVFDRYDSPNFDKPHKKLFFQIQPFY